METLFRKLEEQFSRAQKILILLHLDPDGDTISSSLALSSYLKNIGKQVDCAVNGDVPGVFGFLPGVEDIKKDFLLGDYDLVIAVDCGDTNRTGYPARLEQICRLRTLVNIDHHNRNNLHRIAGLNIVDETAAAAAEIVFELLVYCQAEIDSKIATYILAGIYYDTGGFYHPNVSERTLKIASECLRLGGRMSVIAKSGMVAKTSSGLKLWGIALSRMRVNKRGVVSSFITLRDIKESGATIDDASGIVNLINTVPEAKLSILFTEQPDGKIKASLRTESDKIDVASFARVFGGGGHRKASGFTVDGKLIEENGRFVIED